MDEVSVYPKPIERQKVSTCLKIFCEETRSALLLHPEMANVEGKEDTASFINMVVTFFRIVNVKSKGADIRHNNPLGVITNEDDERLKFLCRFGDMALQMKPSSGRIRQLTVDTAKAIFQTCHGIVDLCINLLSTSHQYVCIGKFTSDFIEKEFSKLRQGSGGCYFITVQQILEKLNINKTSLLLSLNTDIDNLGTNSGHHCSSCSYKLEEDGIETFDNLEKLEGSMTIDTKMALVHISWYVTRNDPVLLEDELLDTTTFYHQNLVVILMILIEDNLTFLVILLFSGVFFVLSCLKWLKLLYVELH